MAQNEYKRQLILLRAHERGYAGHARLERRTLAANLRFTVSGASDRDRLNALLLTNRNGRTHLVKLGVLTTDSRGQSGLHASFDPRNLDGLDLKQYDLIALVRTGDDAPALVLTGLPNGAREIDWGAVTRAAIDACARRGTGAVVRDAPDVGTTVPDVEPESVATEDTTIVEPESVATEDTTIVEPESAATEDTTVVEPEAVDIGTEPATVVVEPTSVQTAYDRLQLDDGQDWPQGIRAIRGLFEHTQASDAFQLEDFVFVDAPLPNEDGTNGVCAIGLRAEDGRPVSVCYALPGAQAVEPPPGLEEYRYLGGWWYTVLDVGGEKALWGRAMRAPTRIKPL